MKDRDLIVIGGSAGSHDALEQIIQGLGQELPATVLLVVHTHPGSRSVLPEVLSRAGGLKAVHAGHGERFEKSKIYVAPPDQHLLVKAGTLVLEHGPRENRQRPAVDPLFRSAAKEHGARVIGVILSGYLDDGVVGLKAIKNAGGVTVVQSLEDASAKGMPEAAIELVHPDFIVRAAEMGPLLRALVTGERTLAASPGTAAQRAETARELGHLEGGTMGTDRIPGTPSGYACPDCHGALWEVDDEGLLRFRCRTGHAYTAETLADSMGDSLEGALWAAVRSLEENASLARRLEARARERSQGLAAARFSARAVDAQAQARLIREMLEGRRPRLGNS